MERETLSGSRGDAAGRIARVAVRVVLVATVLGFAPGLLDVFTPLKAAILRVIGIPLLLFVAVEMTVHRRGPRLRPLDLVVLAWGAAATLSTALGISARLSWLGEIQQREGLLGQFALVGLYFGARRGHETPAHVRGTMVTLIAASTLAAAYALLQRAGLDPVRWQGASIYPTAQGPVLRVFGPLGNAILLGAVMAAALGAGFARALATEHRSPWLLPSLVTTAAVLTATLSRGALLAGAAGLAAAGFAARRERGVRWATVLRTLVLLAVPAGVWAWLALRGAFVARAAETLSGSAESAPARFELARSALALWRGHPWLGVGPDAFGLAFPWVQTPGFWRNGWIGMPVNAHAVPMQVLATGGALTVLLGLAWVALALRPLARRSPSAAWSHERPALFAGLVALCVAGLTNVVGIAGAVIFVALSALSAASDRPSEAAPPETGGNAWLPSLAALALALTLGVTGAGEFRALHEAHAAQGALVAVTESPPDSRSGATAEAVRHARRAAALAPGEDELWRLACDAALAHAAAIAALAPDGADSLAAEAEAAARRALALEPRRSTNLDRLANALAMRGAFDRSLAVFDEAERLAPRDGMLLLDRVSAELRSPEPERALATARRITAMYPGIGTALATEASVWITLGRPDSALPRLERAADARWEADDEGQRQAVLRALEAHRHGGGPAPAGPGVPQGETRP